MDALAEAAAGPRHLHGDVSRVAGLQFFSSLPHVLPSPSPVIAAPVALTPGRLPVLLSHSPVTLPLVAPVAQHLAVPSFSPVSWAPRPAVFSGAPAAPARAVRPAPSRPVAPVPSFPSQPDAFPVAPPLVLASLPPVFDSGAYPSPARRSHALSLDFLRSCRPLPGTLGGPPVAPWRYRRATRPSPFATVARGSSRLPAAPSSSAAAAAVRAFDDAARRRAREISATRAAAAAALAAHALASRDPGAPHVAFPSEIHGLRLQHTPFRRRFARRLRCERVPPVRREFCPRGLTPSSMPDAIASVAASSGLSVACLADAVDSAQHWVRPAPYTSPPVGRSYVASGLSVPGILALEASPSVTDFLVSVATFGASTLSAPPRSRSYRDNHSSAYEFSDAVDALVEERTRPGWLVDVTPLYVADPLLPILVSPIGVVEKSTPGTYRLLLDGSFGAGDCVNDFIDPSLFGAPLLASFDAIVSSILALRRADPLAVILLYTTDIDNAYMRLPIRAADYWQLGQLWRNRVYWNVRAPMGLRPAGHLLYRFTAPINDRIFSLTGHRPETFVDDSIGAALAADMPALAAAMDSVPESVGFPISARKRLPPSTSRVFCGWLFDTVTMTVSLPRDKLLRLRAQISSHALRHRILASDLASLVGALQAACRGVRSSRPYLDTLCAASATATGRWVTLRADARADLLYWHDLLRDFSGTRMLDTRSPDVTVFSDACTSWGWGWVCHDLRVYGYGVWSDEPAIAPPLAHINALELVVGIAAADTVAGLLPVDSSVALRLDNTVAVATVERERGARGHLSHAARALAYLTDTRSFFVASSHIQGIANVVADGLSRGQIPASVSSYRRLHFPSGFLTQIASSPRPSLVLGTVRGSPTPAVGVPSPKPAYL